jgi:cation-transporting ATPase E
MVSGSSAARNACDFVLLSEDFSTMTQVLREGRRVINNIETVACLYLVKTIYSLLLTVLFIFLPYNYPFTPLQLFPINVCTVGIPTFFLAMQKNYKKPDSRFARNILLYSVPSALSVVISILVLQLAGLLFDLSVEELSVMNVLVTGCLGFCLLYWVAKPMKPWFVTLYVFLILAFGNLIIWAHPFLTLGSPFTRNAFFFIPIMLIGPSMMKTIRQCVEALSVLWSRIRKLTSK